MAYPQIMDVVEGTVTSDDTTWDLTYPDDIVDGELLLCLMGTDGNPNCSATDWVMDADLGATFGKRAGLASLSGTGFVVTLTSAEQGCWKVFRIAGWEGTLGTNFNNSDVNGGSCPAAAFADGTSSTPSPGGMTPFNWSAAAEDTLWIANCVVRGDGSATFSANPVGYTPVGTNLSSGGADGAAFSVCEHEEVVTTEFPGSWTISASELYRCWMHAVRPGDFPIIGDSYMPSGALSAIGF